MSILDDSRAEEAKSQEVLLTVKEYAVFKRVHRKTVERWIRQRLVDAERTTGRHGRWRIRLRKAG